MALCVLWWLTGAVEAPAGTYRAAQCHPGVGAGHADVSFQRSSHHYRGSSDCRPTGTGLAVTHRAAGSREGAWGAWTLRAPTGAVLTRVEARAAGKAKGGHVPELLVGASGDELRRFASPRGDLDDVAWTGEGERLFRVRLRCASARCGPGRDARVRIRRLLVRVRDAREPTLQLSDSLFARSTRRGMEEIGVSARDAGAGVRTLFVHVNGEPAAATTLPCALADGIATRLHPCPSPARATFPANTVLAPFRQGPNRVRVCALDYMLGTGANRACKRRHVRVDNACPRSGVDDGDHLRARLVGGGRRMTIRGGHAARVAGRLLDVRGRGLQGGEVCVATRTALPGTAERVLRTPLTGRRGGFAVKLPEGPSRQVRVAYWSDAERPLERYLGLRVRARPRLGLRPDGVLHNGDRVHFRVGLPGPRAGGRLINLKVRANGRWLPLRRGRTNGRGVWTGSYRFRATTGRERYRFRAFVPKQRAYPYEAGHSKVRRQTVVG